MSEPITTSQQVLRLAYRVAYLLIYSYRFLRRPQTYGVQLILTSGTQLLLVKHTYGHRSEWALPGGGRRRGESALACAHRELAEELGVVGVFREVDVVEVFHNYHYDTVNVFVVTGIWEQLQLDKIEISEAQWFEANNLPTNLTVLAATVLRKNLVGVRLNEQIPDVPA